MKEELKFTNIGNKESQKELIKEIMDLDAKDGLYENNTNEIVSATYTGEYPFTKQETLYTEEQVWQAAFDAYIKANNESYELTPSDIIKSLKQPKKD